jgi:hypothetical protein
MTTMTDDLGAGAPWMMNEGPRNVVMSILAAPAAVMCAQRGHSSFVMDLA